MGLGRLAGGLNSKVKSALASMGATFSMRSICLTRLCACLALEALALKRSMNFCRWAILSCWRSNEACCSRICWARSSSNLRSEEHTSELQSPDHLVSRLLLEKKKNH